MNFLEKAWIDKAGWLILLWPLSLLFQILTGLRRKLVTNKSSTGDVPVVVIGNISLGGTGKTPLLLALVQYYKKKGMRPGVISRGYGGRASSYPLTVDENTDVSQCGDEALLIALNTECPVIVDPDRRSALKTLLDHNSVDVVFSDDGLQHYRLRRDIEIAVVDGVRLFGNGWCLPAGPLREPVQRLAEVDYIVVNGETSAAVPELSAAHSITLAPTYLVNQVSGDKRPFSDAPFKMGNTIQAVAALGNPERFFATLDKLPYPMRRFPFPDHHLFRPDDFTGHGIDEHQPIVMTEKDAIKCRNFAQDNFWVLKVDVTLPQALLDALDKQLAALLEQTKG